MMRTFFLFLPNLKQAKGPLNQSPISSSHDENPTAYCLGTWNRKAVQETERMAHANIRTQGIWSTGLFGDLKRHLLD